MEKGKIKNEKKYISIIIVPHFPSNVKTLKFSALYSKFIAVLITILAAFLFMSIFLGYTYGINVRLKRQADELMSINAEQRYLLGEKASEISSLIGKEENTSSIIKDFLMKYSEIADTYITGRLSSLKVSRSADGNDKSFAKDLSELKDILSTLDMADDQKNKYLAELSETEEKLKKYLDSIPTLWPVKGEISSDYGRRKDPFVWKQTFHDGIDIAAPHGENIKAAASGTVILAGWTKVYGRTVIIKHDHGITTLYGHASKLLVKDGQAVKKGDIIARVGSSGRSTGDHLHFEVRVNDSIVDPHKYLDKK